MQVLILKEPLGEPKKQRKTFHNFDPVTVGQRKKMVEEDKCDEHEKNFHMVFYCMSEMVERMYGDYEKRMKKKGRKRNHV